MNIYKKIIFLCAIIILHFIFTNMNLLRAQNPIGAIPGVIDVSPMGAATYTIPIEVVPGTQGMQPNLSIVYNSMSGMGLLGMKWNLAGLSAITRCGQTPYYDNGNITAIQFSRDDRFALDGERLMRLSEGSYGAKGEYATEMENFTRIVSHGVYTTGHPTYFMAYTDDGSIIEYGNSTNSKQQLGDDNNSIISWYISKITDFNGNFMTFEYSGTNEKVISKIKYTGHTNGSQPYAEVVFDYIDLPDDLGKNTYFIGGHSMPQTQLLNTITIKYNNARVLKYQFICDLNAAKERTAHLKEVVLYGENDQIRLNSTIITWGAQNNIIEDSDPTGVVSGSIVTGDFDGDGCTDYVVYNQGSGTNRSFQLHLKNPTHNNFYSVGTPGSGSSLPAYAYSGDFYGKGKDALILAENRNMANSSYLINVYSYDNHKWQKNELGSVAYFFQAHLGDFTGDGKVNIMYVSLRRVGTKDQYTLSFSNNDFYSAPLQFYNVDHIQIIDYNGNGKANIQVTRGNITEVHEYSPSEQRFIIVSSTGFPTQWHHFFHGDFNGDGITDIIEFTENGEWIIKFGLGNGYYTWPGENLKYLNPIKDSKGAPKYPLFIADINGDGKDDIIQPSYDHLNAENVIVIHFSKGLADEKYQSSFEFVGFSDDNYENFGNFVSGYLWHLGDYNGDGKNDLLLRKSNSDTQPKIIHFNKNEQYEFVKKITDGLGKETTISYTPTYLSFISSSLGRDKKAFMQLVTEIQTSNGIGGMNKLEFSYANPLYGTKRRTFLGFWEFTTKSIDSWIITTDVLHLRPEGYPTHHTDGLEILLPYQKILTKNLHPYTFNKIEYQYQRIPLLNKRFIIHNNSTRNQDNLSDTKTETTTTLENGRIKTSNTKTFNSSNSTTQMHSETNTYSYQTIPLNGNQYQEKTVPTQILTTQQFGSSGLIIADTLTCNYSGTGRLNWKRQGNIDGSITTTYGNYTHTGLYREKTVSATGCTPRKEYYEYDNNTHRFVTKIKNHLLHEATMNYDAKTGNKLSETDINGLTTTYQYDNFSNLTKIIYPDNTQTNISTNWYSSSDLPNAKYQTTTTSTGNPDLIVYYDILGREVCRKDDGNYFKTIYNNKGQINKTIGFLSNITSPESGGITNQYFYDNYDRKSMEIAPYTDLSFSYNNRTITVTDNLRAVSSYKEYDALGRITKAGDEGGTIDYAYSVTTVNGKRRHRTSITTNRASTIILSDLWGNRLSIEEPNAGTITSEYNKFNELIEQKDANNNITTYQYDVLGRVTQKEHKVSSVTKEVIKYVYDTSNKGKGKLHQIISNNIITEIYSYDANSRLCKLEKGVEGYKTFQYTYTPTGQLHTYLSR